MMKAVVILTLLALAGATEVTPVEKVIQLLNGMVSKGNDDKQAEATQYNQYRQFCDDTSTEKKRSIAEAEEQMEMLTADIQKYETTAATLGQEIAELDEELSIIAGDMNAATNVRDMEHDDFLAKQKDYGESIKQVGIATDVVKAENKDVSMVQLKKVAKLPTLSEQSKRALMSFVSEDPEDVDAENLAVADPSVNAYESSSSGILDLFKKMNGKFDEQLMETQKKEMKDKHAFEMLMTDLTNSKTVASQSRQEKSEAKAKNLEAAAEAKSSLADTTATRDTDAKYLADLEATCAQKASDFASRQKLRGEEIEALEQATEILAGGAVSGAAATHLPALMQTKSFVQLRSSTKNPEQQRVADFLKTEAARINSKVLSAISMRVAYDPFKSVKKMVKDMIVKLMEEANEEAEHKGWCDQELATNEQTRKEKTEAVEVLHSEIDELEATIAQLTEQIAELNAAIADSDKAVAEATEIRENEKAKNAVTVKDARAAQEAVANALNVLNEFYAKAGGATALVQTAQAPPESFDTAYTGMQSESGGVVGMIEVIQSDFARLESETSASEASNAEEYAGFMADSEADKAAKTTDIEHKESKKQNSEQSLTEKKDDLAGTQDELSAALSYYEKLKPDCVNANVSYNDRVAMRKEEIASLQEALKILNGEDIA